MIMHYIGYKLGVSRPQPKGGLKQVFFLKQMVRASKKSGVTFGSPAEVPQILPPNPKIWVIMTNHPILLSNTWRGDGSRCFS